MFSTNFKDLKIGDFFITAGSFCKKGKRIEVVYQKTGVNECQVVYNQSSIMDSTYIRPKYSYLGLENMLCKLVEV